MLVVLELLTDDEDWSCVEFTARVRPVLYTVQKNVPPPARRNS